MKLARIVPTPGIAGTRSAPSSDFHQPSTHSRLRRRAGQTAAAAGILVSTLAVAGPSWAGPMSGC